MKEKCVTQRGAFLALRPEWPRVLCLQSTAEGFWEAGWAPVGGQSLSTAWEGLWPSQLFVPIRHYSFGLSLLPQGPSQQSGALIRWRWAPCCCACVQPFPCPALGWMLCSPTRSPEEPRGLAWLPGALHWGPSGW